MAKADDLITKIAQAATREEASTAVNSERSTWYQGSAWDNEDEIAYEANEARA